MVRDSGSEWSEGVIEQVVFKFYSNHLPILLLSNVISYDPCLFSFFNTWSDHLNLRSVVKEEWEGSGVLVSCFWGHMKAIKWAMRR